LRESGTRLVNSDVGQQVTELGDYLLVSPTKEPFRSEVICKLVLLIVSLAVPLFLTPGAYAQAKAVPPSDAELKEGQKLYESGDVAGALAKYRQILLSRPDDPGVLFLIGQALGDQGALQEGEQAYLKAIGIYLQKQARASSSGVTYRPNIAMVLNNLANLYGRENRFDQASTAIDQAFKAWPTPRSTPAELFVTRGIVLEGQNNSAEAIQAYREGLARSSQNADALLNLGILLTKEGKPEEATTLLERGVKISPNDPAMFAALGNSEWKSKQLNEAAASFRRAVELTPDDADLHMNLASVLESLGRAEEAKKEQAEAERLRASRRAAP
jgi:tetratricopeptide (TPR) repeat protein